MRLIINPKIFVNFPGLIVGVVVARGVDNTKTYDDVTAFFTQEQKKIQDSLSIEALADDPRITVWRQAYSHFKSRPSDYRSSIENLCRIVLKGKQLRQVNSLVDIYNYISLKYLLPVGGEDIDTVQGNIHLTYAADNEKPVLLLGDTQAEAPYHGEIIYKDNLGALCRRWNWRESDRTKLTTQTRNAVFVLEALPPVSEQTIKKAVAQLQQLIEKYCGGTVESFLLSKNNPYAEIIPGGLGDDVESNNTPQDLIALADDKHASQEHTIRVEKVLELRKQGIEPWPQAKPVTASSQQIIEEFQQNKQEKEYSVTGRLMTIRLHGKTAFATIQDATGRLQIYIRKDEIGDHNFSLFQHLIDLGDIIWVRGNTFITNSGEISLKVHEFTLVSKCLYPLPEKFHGLTDIETKYRQRYLDLITNQESRTKFIKRSLVVRSLRHYLDSHGFLEVETPMLHPIPGGAAARPFITHHNALSSDFYLRIAPELYLKRLVIGGLERVYEINRNFRNEGVSTRHNPEFTMVEFYIAHRDYFFAMDFVEALLRTVVTETDVSLKIPYGERTLDFSVPFTRLTVKDSVKKYGKYTDKDLSIESIDTTLHEQAIVLENKVASLGQKIFALFEKIVESQLIQPTFITEFPIEISPLAKRDQQNPQYAARFELFIGGMEIANSFNELNDPFDQAERFKEQLKAHAAGDTEAHHYDADYILALEYGLPPTVGVGIGIDRLIMLVTNTLSIKDVILFPTLKKK